MKINNLSDLSRSKTKNIFMMFALIFALCLINVNNLHSQNPPEITKKIASLNQSGGIVLEVPVDSLTSYLYQTIENSDTSEIIISEVEVVHIDNQYAVNKYYLVFRINCDDSGCILNALELEEEDDIIYPLAPEAKPKNNACVGNTIKPCSRCIWMNFCDCLIPLGGICAHKLNISTGNIIKITDDYYWKYNEFYSMLPDNDTTQTDTNTITGVVVSPNPSDGNIALSLDDTVYDFNSIEKVNYFVYDFNNSLVASFVDKQAEDVVNIPSFIFPTSGTYILKVSIFYFQNPQPNIVDIPIIIYK